MKPTVLVVLAAIGLGLGYCWHRGEVRAAIEQAETQRTVDSLAAAESTLAAVQRVRDSLTAVWVADTLRLTADRRRLAVQARRLADSLPSLLLAVESLRLDDTASRVVGAVVTSFERQVAACGAQVSILDSLWSGCATELAGRDSTITELRDLSVARQDLVETLQRQAKPGFFTRFRRGLPWLAVGLLVGAVVVR